MAVGYASFVKCALQVNPFSYSAAYQGADHGLAEDQYNEAIAKRCLGVTDGALADG
jgi:hypothetical protein